VVKPRNRPHVVYLRSSQSCKATKTRKTVVSELREGEW
jgi:hypothetical protein